MNADGRGGGSGREEWAALHHIADSVRGDAAGALGALRGFVGGLSAAGRLGSFAGWNAMSGSVGRPLDVFNDAAVADDDGLDDKTAMYELFYLNGAECSAPEGRRYCGLPREEHSFLNVGATGPVVTLVGGWGRFGDVCFAGSRADG